MQFKVTNLLVKSFFGLTKGIGVLAKGFILLAKTMLLNPIG
jgi:hypothetical protein